jgi:hypothetical protein
VGRRARGVTLLFLIAVVQLAWVVTLGYAFVRLLS